MTELHEADDRGREVTHLEEWRARQVRPDELELADPAPATHQPGDQLVPAEKVYDAELVDEGTRPARPTVKAMAERIGKPLRTVSHHEPTVRTTKAVARHLVYVYAGLGVVANRLWEAKTKSRYERQMRAAEAAGDQERLRYWQEQGQLAEERRHKRRMDLLTLPYRLAKALLVLMPLVSVLLLLLGLAFAINEGDLSLVLAPLLGTVSAVGWLVGAFIWLLTWLLILGPMWALGKLWQMGRRADTTPQRLAPHTDKDGDVMDGLPDERMITQALRKTLPALDRAIKESWKLHYLVPPMPDGKGWAAEIALPPAAPVEDFVRNKTTLAHNLRRYPNEVWLTEPQAAVLRLWVAKPGALSGPVDPWPLLKNLDTAKTDYFKGVPVGVTIKGDVIKGRLSEANWVAGGMMGSGKSTLIITALLGAMLDPLVDIDVVVMAQNADYDPMKPRLNRLVTGVGEETVEQCMAMLYELFDDLTIRGKALKEHDERAVTREIAEKDARLRPRILVIDECQNLFISDHGKDAIEITIKVMSTARKYGITLMFLTPEPSKDALPRKLISVASNKACFAIGDHQANDAVLGSGSYKTGISAVGLTPKTEEGPGDVGTCMQRGFTGRPGLMRGFYVSQSDAHRVTQRALQLRGGRRLIAAAPPVEKRDLLVDVGKVIGDQTMPAADIPPLLAREFPGQVLYREMTGKQLRQILWDDHRVRVPKTDNRFPVSPKLIAAGIAARGD